MGKTVTALNLADVLRRAGKSVVLVDCDGQANLTEFYLREAALDALEDGGITVTDLLMGAVVRQRDPAGQRRSGVAAAG